MNTILKREDLAAKIVRLRITAPRIAKQRKAGQFIIVKPDASSERIPLTIAQAHAQEGWIEIIFQVVGHGTIALGSKQPGDTVADLVGPLGKPTHIEKFGRCLCVGGGVGIAPLFPIVSALKAAGNHVTTVIGGRTSELVLLQSEMQSQSDRVFIATDDGSLGTHGFVTTVCSELFSQGELFDFAIVIGPAMMMKVTSQLLIKQGIRTFVSLNPIMIDGTGMCGGCRLTVFGKTQFGCVDGPEFDASGIDWDQFIQRLGSYKSIEAEAVKNVSENHDCVMKVAS